MLESLDTQSITHDLFIAVDDFCTFLRAPEQEELVDERLRNDLQQSLLLNWSIWSKGEKNVQQYVIDKVTKAMERDLTLREAYASSFYLTYGLLLNMILIDLSIKFVGFIFIKFLLYIIPFPLLSRILSIDSCKTSK